MKLKKAAKYPAYFLISTFILMILASMALLEACHVSQDEKVENTISFNRLYDTIAQFDSVLITLKDLDGHTIDVVFEGKVKRPDDVTERFRSQADGRSRPRAAASRRKDACRTRPKGESAHDVIGPGRA